MKRFGIISYNIYCNFTNYGSALQSWALQRAVDGLGQGEAVLVDYCPDVLLDKNPRDPIAHMWDTDAESRRMCELSLPAIRENADKFDRFYRDQFRRTKQTYTSRNFDDAIKDEQLDGFICGGDTIFCINEFKGFDDGYYANYPSMQGRSIAYGASFGDAHFTPETYGVLRARLGNFRALGLREDTLLPFVRENTSIPVRRVLDPTLLLTAEDYSSIMAPRLEEQPYLLLYARRHNPEMSSFAEKLAEERGWKIIEISLRAVNAQRRRMFYEAGVEEFLSLVRHAEFVVTNSYHGMIFSVQYKRDFVIFSREQCDVKIAALLDLLGLTSRLLTEYPAKELEGIDYQDVWSRIARARSESLLVLKDSLALLQNQ